MAENPHPSDEVTYKAVSESDGSTITVGGTEFEILEFISSGGSAEVYKAVQKNKQGQSPVAIKKVSLNQPRTIDKFLEEVNLLDRMKSNPRVVQLLAHEESKDARGNKFLFEVMELGDDDLDHYLVNRIKKEEYLTDQEIKGLWLQMLQAVQSVHAFGVIHLDLKPANFILVKGWVKLIDFGLSMATPKPSGVDLPSSKSSTDLKMLRNSTCGTLVYAAPEVLANNASYGGLHLLSNKSDVWSLGCILYLMVHHKLPLQESDFSKNSPTKPIEFPSVGTYDPEVNNVLKLCLKTDPSERASIEELLEHPYLKKNLINQM